MRAQLYQLLLDHQGDDGMEVTSPQNDEFLDRQDNLETVEPKGGNPAAPILSLHALHGS